MNANGIILDFCIIVTYVRAGGGQISFQWFSWRWRVCRRGASLLLNVITFAAAFPMEERLDVIGVCSTLSCVHLSAYLEL